MAQKEPSPTVARARDFARSIFRFGDFELIPAKRRLALRGQPVAVGQRAFDVLVALVERPGQLVTKDELFERVWPRLIVEENNLQVQVSALRRILGAQAIETIAGFGYRFVPNVEDTALPAAPIRKHNLPSQYSSFVGREREVAELQFALRTTRLLTIVGVGGLGKTRLALRVAEQVLADYDDGVWYVDLAPIASGDTLPQAVATALGVSEDAQKSTTDVITNHVERSRMLVVLNNCEHVLGATADLARHLLACAPRLQILVTSREALHVFGEVVHGVVPLSLPAIGVKLSAAELSEYESTRLFADRAAAVNPSFRVAAGDVATLVDICRRVDGIPLAIELAAARVRVLSLDMIAQRLAKRFTLLTGGDRTALPRQQTLRSMIDWSYELLTPAERILLARLSVFSGGCTLEAAESVAADGLVAEHEVVDLLGNLVEKSMAVRDPAGERYRLLETVREYARDRLEAAGEASVVRDRHLAFLLALAERSEPAMRQADTLAWVAQLNLERDNFLSAYAWCASTGNAEAGLLMLHALRLWLWRAAPELGLHLAGAVFALPIDRASPRARCLGYYAAAAIEYFAARYQQSISHGEACLVVAREIGDALKVVDALVVIGAAGTGAGQPARAREALEAALAGMEGVDDITRRTDILCNLAELDAAEGNFAAAIPLSEEALALCRAMANRHATAVNACNLARNRLACGTDAGAADLLREAVACVDPGLPDHAMQLVFIVAMGVAGYDDDWQRVAQLTGAAEFDLAHRNGTRERADIAFVEPLLSRTRSALGERAFEEAAQRGRASGYVEALAAIDQWLAQR